jgi:hypothetical protein
MDLEKYLRGRVEYEAGKKTDLSKYKTYLQTNVGFLQELYAAIESPDGASSLRHHVAPLVDVSSNACVGCG